MTSNLACVGLAVKDQGDLASLIERVGPRAHELGRAGPFRVMRWQDPSGVRLVLGVTDSEMSDLLPSFAGSVQARLASLQMVNDDVAIAAVVDASGEQLTSAALEVEQRRLLSDRPLDQVSATITALGVDVEVFDSTESFDQSDTSLLGDESSGGEPPSHYVENGWKWPPRVAANSFFSYGVFNEGDAALSSRGGAGPASPGRRRGRLAPAASCRARGW